MRICAQNGPQASGSGTRGLTPPVGYAVVTVPGIARRDLLVHGGLFLAACATTTIAGGAAFAATLMTILTCHEFGPNLVERLHVLEVSMRYFIPLPPVFPLGTQGAVIIIR